MADPIDELAQRWKQNPSPAATIALCDALRGAPRAALVQQVGEIASSRFAGDVTVLLSVARMYLEAHRFGDAQATLVAAGKLSPREGMIYRWLGEALLRRGDAERAEKVLERSLQLGVRDTDAQLWLERARVFRPMQAKAGVRAVAAEVAHATAPPRPPMDSLSDSTTAVHVRPSADDLSARPGRPDMRALAPPTPVPPEDDEPPPDDDEPTRMGRTPPIPAAGRAPSISAEASAQLFPQGRPRHPQNAPTEPKAFDLPPLTPLPALRVPAQSSTAETEVARPVTAPLAAAPALPMPHGSQGPHGAPAAPAAPALPAFEPAPPVAAASPFAASPATSPFQAPAPAPFPAPIPTSPVPARSVAGIDRAPLKANGAARAARSAPTGVTSVPHPRDVLDALALAGVYEPPEAGAAGAAAWAAADSGPRRKGGPTLIVGMVLFLAASVGVYLFYRHKRAEEHAQAEAILAQVEQAMHAGKPASLPEIERQIAQAFQLESRSPRAALDWARERALVGLVKAGDDVAFEDAMNRAKEVGVPEEKYAFARVASFLFQGDTGGAAAVLPRWDGPAGIDPWYDVVAGATLERAGDARAKDRYAAATKLDPELFVAAAAQSRSTTVEGDAAEGMRLAQALRKQYPDRAEPVALVALAWGRDVNRESVAPPPEVDEVARRIDELPTGLKFVPHAIAALQAFDKHATDDARAAVGRGLAVADSPGAAVWLGTIALPLGDEALARKGALNALHLSAVYEPARALAARVALLGDRLDEALKATEDLDANSPDVAVVRAAAAYERADADGVSRALEALPAEARKLPFLAALAMAPDAMVGKVPDDPAKLATLGADDPPWSDLVAMDVALDAGDLATADKIAEAWGKGSEQQPLRALRLSRLARYESRLDQADALSQTALEHGTVTPRVLWERVSVLVARGRAAEVGPLLAKTPLVLGPLATWLSAYAAASNGSVESAKGKTSSVDPPPPTAPLEARIVAAQAFGAMKDKRRGADYVRDLLASGNLDPDLVTAALELGFHKVEHFKRKPTFE